MTAEAGTERFRAPVPHECPPFKGAGAADEHLDAERLSPRDLPALASELERDLFALLSGRMGRVQLRPHGGNCKLRSKAPCTLDALALLARRKTVPGP